MYVFFLTSFPLSIVSVISTFPLSINFSSLLTDKIFPSFLYFFSMIYLVCWPLTVSQLLDSEYNQPQLCAFSSGFDYFDQMTVLASYGLPRMLLISFQKSSKKLPNPKSSKFLLFFESTMVSYALATSANLVAASVDGSFLGWFFNAKLRQASFTYSMVASFLSPRTLQGSQTSSFRPLCFLKNSFYASVLHQFYLKNCSKVECGSFGSLLDWVSSSDFYTGQFLTLILHDGLNNFLWNGKKGSAKSSRGLKQNRLIQSLCFYYNQIQFWQNLQSLLNQDNSRFTFLSHLSLIICYQIESIEPQKIVTNFVFMLQNNAKVLTSAFSDVLNNLKRLFTQFFRHPRLYINLIQRLLVGKQPVFFKEAFS